MKRIPVSRFKRELNSLLKLLKSHPDLVIMVTRNKQDLFILLSTEKYEEMTNYET